MRNRIAGLLKPENILILDAAAWISYLAAAGCLPIRRTALYLALTVCLLLSCGKRDGGGLGKP